MAASDLTPPTVAELGGVALLSALDESQLAELAGCARVRRLGENERLFEHGQPATHLFLLRSGRVKLLRFTADGAEKVITLIGSGEVFAEAVIFFDAPDRRYPVTAEAVVPSEVVALEGECMLGLLRGSIDTCFRMMADMSRRLRWQVDEIENLTLHNATYRLVHYLLRDATERSGTVRLEVPKHVVASRLTIQPETLSRILARLSRDDLIAVHGNEIVLRDPERLGRILES